MSYSWKAVFKATGCFVLVLVLGFALALGLAACGDEGTDTDDGDVTTTTAASTDDTGTTTAGSSDVVGKWYCAEIGETIEFTADGGVNLTVDGTDLSDVLSYTADDGDVVVSIMGTADTLDFTLDGDELTTEDPQYGTLVYTKS